MTSHTSAVGARLGARRRRGVHGQATAEFALVLPFVVLLFLGLLQVALIARDYVLVIHAARAAAREASVDAGADRVRAAATSVLDGAKVDAGPKGAVGEPIRVSVRYTSRTDVPIVGALLPDRELTASSVMRVER